MNHPCPAAATTAVPDPAESARRTSDLDAWASRLRALEVQVARLRAEFDLSRQSDSERPSAEPATVSGERTEADSVISVGELAALLGLERKTVYNLIHLGQIPGLRRLGRRIRVHRPTVISWLRNGQGSVPRSRSTP